MSLPKGASSSPRAGLPVLGSPGIDSRAQILDPTPGQPEGASLCAVGPSGSALGAHGQKQVAADPRDMANHRPRAAPPAPFGGGQSHPEGAFLAPSLLPPPASAVTASGHSLPGRLGRLTWRIQWLLGGLSPHPCSERGCREGKGLVGILGAHPGPPYPLRPHPLQAAQGRDPDLFAGTPALLWAHLSLGRQPHCFLSPHESRWPWTSPARVVTPSLPPSNGFHGCHEGHAASPAERTVGVC